jgi:hypothetical protein
VRAFFFATGYPSIPAEPVQVERGGGERATSACLSQEALTHQLDALYRAAPQTESQNVTALRTATAPTGSSS